MRVLLLLVGWLAVSPAVAQGIYLSGVPLGTGFSLGYVDAESERAVALTAGVAFAQHFDVGVLYGASEMVRRVPNQIRTRIEEGTSMGMYLGYTSAAGDRNALRLRTGVSFQRVSVSFTEAGRRYVRPENTLLGVELTAVRPFGGSAFAQPMLSGALRFSTNQMQASQSFSAGLGFGLRGPQGTIVLEPVVSYTPRLEGLSVGGGLTLAFPLWSVAPRRDSAP